MNYVSPCSARQIQIMRHALAWPKSYRNHYVTYLWSEDFIDCDALFWKDMMTRCFKPMGGIYLIDSEQYIYCVTELGIKELERIDQSDEVKL